MGLDNRSLTIQVMNKSITTNSGMDYVNNIFFRDGIAMFKYRWNKYIDVKGDNIENSEKLSRFSDSFWMRLRTLRMTLIDR